MSLRTRLLLTFLLISTGAVILVGVTAYRVSEERMRQTASVAVEVAARERLQSFRRSLERRVDRAVTFLEANRDRCGQAAPDREACLAALEIFQAVEGFGGAQLRVAGAPWLEVGDWRADVGLEGLPRLERGEVALFSRRSDQSVAYTVEGRDTVAGTTLVVRYDDLTNIIDIFEDRGGLGQSGEIFLADANGFFITPPRYPTEAGFSHPIDAMPMRDCLSGRTDVALAHDYRGGRVIHAYRPVRWIGGGCVMAHIEQDEAFAPLADLRAELFRAGAASALLVVVLSLLLARSFSRPILRLAAAARRVPLGEPAELIPVEGPEEIRTLGLTLRQLVGTMRERTEALEEANRAKTDFLAAMSHELRTPLNAIAGYADLIVEGIYGPVSEDQRKALGRVRHSQRSLLALINDILQYAKIEAGSFEYQIARVELTDLLQGVSAVMEQQIRGADLEFSVDPVPPDLAVHADPDRTQQILLNLLSNAIKFTDSGGSVAVEIVRGSDTVELRVRDTGIGIPADMHERIFDPFVQIRATGDSDETRPGVGLGLAISRDLARSMGGDLTVESTPGAGSTFVLTLPRSEGG